MNAGALNYTLKVRGVEDYTHKLHLFPPVLGQKLRRMLVSLGQRVVRRAKELAPKDTRHLSEGVHAQWSPHNPTIRQIVADTGGDDYRHIAAPVEFGRKKFNRKDAQPFMRPALQGMEAEIYHAAIDALDATAKSVGLTGMVTRTPAEEIISLLTGH